MGIYGMLLVVLGAVAVSAVMTLVLDALVSLCFRPLEAAQALGASDGQIHTRT